MPEHQRQDVGLLLGGLPCYHAPFRAISHSLDAPSPWKPKQVVSRHIQIRQCAGGEQSVRVLREPFVAHLHEPEDVLDDAKGVLDLGPDFRFVPVLRLLDLIDLAPVAATSVGHVARLRRALFDDLGLPWIGTIAPALGLPGASALARTASCPVVFLQQVAEASKC